MRLSVGSSRRARHRRSLTALAVTAAALLGLAAPAGAAVPREWFGVMADGPLLRDSRVKLDAEMRLMAASGVGSARVAIYWSDVERERGQYDWAATDRAFTAAAKAGIRILPTVVRTPDWAAEAPGQLGTVPRDYADYAAFLRVTVGRYGANGTFWAEHPDIRRLPPTMWQVWNEPDIDHYWTRDPWIATYLELLRLGRDAIKAADPAAKVVLGGLTNFSWEELDDIYEAGGRGAFDIAAIHPFSRRPSNVLKIVKLARRAMVRGGDRNAPLLLTEVSWSSGKGRSTKNYGWEMTEKGQAKMLREGVSLLARNRKTLGIAGFYWFTWLSPAPGSKQSFDYSGLRKMNGHRPVSKPALKAYRKVARQFRR